MPTILPASSVIIISLIRVKGLTPVSVVLYPLGSAWGSGRNLANVLVSRNGFQPQMNIDLYPIRQMRYHTDVLYDTGGTFEDATMALRVDKVDHENAEIQRRIFEFLAPHEIYSLFIIGNLKSAFPDSHIYVASRDGEWVGIAGYYGRPKSITPFSFDEDATRLLVRNIVEHHQNIKYLNAISIIAEPASDELCRYGYEIVSDPRRVFMSLEGEPAPQAHEECVRLSTEDDCEQIAGLLRLLIDQPPDLPVTEEEISAVRSSPPRHVLDIGGQIVSMAKTNGMGLTAFQILAVATHSDYRNKGYARAVCAALIRAMSKEGARQTIIFTGHQNIAAQQCYMRLGFETIEDFWVAQVRKA